MPNFFSELQEIKREYTALRHKAARISQSRDTRRLPGLRRQIEIAENALESLRAIVLQQQAAERTPAYFRKSYSFETWTENKSRRIKNVN